MAWHPKVGRLPIVSPEREQAETKKIVERAYMMADLLKPADLAVRYGDWAVVAGASEGIGLALAEALAAAGINLLMVARRRAILDPAAARIASEHKVEAIPLSIDLSAPGATQAIADAATGRDVGIFVYNAGGESSGARFIEGNIADWTALVNRNIQCLTESLHFFTRLFVARGRGALLNVCSGAALGGCDHLSVYSATKAFGLTLCEAMWYELRGKGVDVLSILLDGTDTPTTRATLFAHGIDPEGMQLARPEMIAEAALARLDAGPVWFYGETDADAPRATARRAHVEEVSAMMALFYGAD